MRLAGCDGAAAVAAARVRRGGILAMLYVVPCYSTQNAVVQCRVMLVEISDNHVQDKSDMNRNQKSGGQDASRHEWHVIISSVSKVA